MEEIQKSVRGTEFPDLFHYMMCYNYIVLISNYIIIDNNIFRLQ